MLRYILLRLASAVPTFVLMVTCAFFIVRLAPGSPFSNERALTPETRAALDAAYGLDAPLWTQLGRYMVRVIVHQDLGVSLKYTGRSINEMLWAGIPYTLAVGLGALAWALCVGITTGILGALHHRRLGDSIALGIAMVGLGVPSFVLGPALIYLLALHLDILPPAGLSSARHVILPAITLGSVYAATLSRLTRAGLLEVLQSDFVRTARAKGLSMPQVVRRHVLLPALMPLLTYLGPVTAGLLTGSVVVEKMFNVPGIGPYFIDAALNRDYFLVMGIVVLESLAILSCNLVVDVLHALCDPRIRLD